MIGVKYTCSQDPSGYGEAARVDVASLFTSGINVTVQAVKQMVENSDYGLAGDIVNRLKDRNIPYKVQLFHLTPDLIPIYQEKGIYMISRLAWETDRVPKEWVAPLNSIQEIWTMSPQMSEMVKKSGVVTPCYNFPQAIDTAKADEKIKPFSLHFPKDFIFYTVAQFIDRKNFRGLLRAYWKAFEGNDKVSLLLKTYRMNYSPTEYELIKADIEKWKKELGLKNYPKVGLIKKLMTGAQVDKLHALGDCYVASSSGEGWNRPVQEAMLYGKPVISGDNGGITDLMSVAEYYDVPSMKVPATEVSSIPWYSRYMNWKELDEKSLTGVMQTVYSKYKESLIVAKEAQKFVIDQFSFQKVGQQMKIRLKEIYERMQ